MAAGGAGGGHRLVRSAAVYRCSEAAAALGLLLSPAGRRHRHHYPPHITCLHNHQHSVINLSFSITSHNHKKWRKALCQSEWQVCSQVKLEEH